jgi:putative transposase
MPRRAYRYRFYPTPEQEALLRRTCGCVRYVWNWALETRSTAYVQHGERIGYVALSAALTALKADPEHQWLGEVSSVPLQQTLRHQQQALAGFFDKRPLPQIQGQAARQAVRGVHPVGVSLGRCASVAGEDG